MEELPQDPSKMTVFGLPKMREKVITMLTEAFTNNDLELQDYEDRLKIAHEARYVEELKPAVHDFPQARNLFPAPIAASQNYFPAERKESFMDLLDEPDVFTFIGNRRVDANDFLSPVLKEVTIIGDAIIDLRNIAYKFNYVKIRHFQGIGTMKILVPANAEIRQNISVVIGEVSKKVRGDSVFAGLLGKKTPIPEGKAHPFLPPLTVELTGTLLIGEVKIIYERDDQASNQ